MNPHQATVWLEKSLCDYTGAKYAVCVNSCTMALELALLFQRFLGFKHTVIFPKHTYVSVPQAAVRAGFEVRSEDFKWTGEYRLDPYPVWDSAKRFTKGMYRKGQYQCVSFHVAKIFGDTQGGVILHDDEKADEFFRLARFDGRQASVKLKDDVIGLPAVFTRHCYMSPDVAIRLLNHMQYLPEVNPDQEEVYADVGYIR